MNKVIEKLFEYSEESIKLYDRNIIKGNSPFIGVRIPILRKLAKNIIKDNLVENFFINYEGKYFEEKLLKGLIIASKEEYFFELNSEYLNELDSWCLVDTYANSCKFINNNLDKYWDFVKSLIDNKNEFIIRCGFVFILYYYLDDKYIDEIIKLVLKKYDYYYVNMAIAWLLSEIYIKYPMKVMNLLESSILCNFVHEKTIDKINDSFRVSDEDKRILRGLK